jgi:hypothetical protein
MISTPSLVVAQRYPLGQSYICILSWKHVYCTYFAFVPIRSLGNDKSQVGKQFRVSDSIIIVRSVDPRKIFHKKQFFSVNTWFSVNFFFFYGFISFHFKFAKFLYKWLQRLKIKLICNFAAFERV